MTNKKLFAPLFIAGACLLASCSTSTIVARPGWSDNPIIDAKDLKDNQMKVIYDAIKALGDTNANVLNEVLYKIAVNQVGDYSELKNYRSDNTTVNDNDPNLIKFVNSHALYKPTSTKLAYKNNSGKIVTEDLGNNSIKASRQLIQQQYDELIENVYEALYNEIKGGSYSKNNLFDEEKFYRNIRKNMYNTLEPSKAEQAIKDAGDTRGWAKDIVLISKETRALEKSDKKITWKEYVNRKNDGTSEGGFLHIVKDNGEFYGDAQGTLYKDYIETKVMKDVYRNFLIRDYVKEQRYDNIARSYARKVNMITIPYTSTYTEAINELLYNYAKENILVENPQYSYKEVEDAMNGLVGTDGGMVSHAHSLLEKSFTSMKDSSGNTITWTMHGKNGELETTKHDVFKGTKLGDLVEKYQKIYDLNMVGGELKATLKSNPDSAVYKELTNSGAYSIDKGLAIKEREIKLTSYVKHGWYLKNGGLTDLNSTIRDRLFNITTSTIVDNAAKKYGGEKGYEAGDYAVYAQNGKAYLAGDSSSTAVDEKLVVLNDDKNYHIIEIEEAVSTSKMAKDADNNNSYLRIKAATEDAKFESTDAMNEIINEVVKANASGDTYKKNANQYYLMISNILFYDQSVYDYFKSQYPDLFK